MEKTAPAIDRVTVERCSISLAADMELASIPVTVYGQYNVNSNVYHPSQVKLRIDLDPKNDQVNGSIYDIETFCQMMEWDSYETYNAVQLAVEDRDR